jgi:hypothetical protein
MNMNVETFCLTTPVLLVIFNRPETTRAVFESIRAVRPAVYFVVADGPRAQVDGEGARCEEARRIATAVDWDCSMHTLLRDRNLGAGAGVASAITWFFEHAPHGIILEDDCVASSSFYRFCQELLARYEDNPEVMHISGNNFQYGRKRGGASYYFSRYTHTWGWATWRRAWNCYDFEVVSKEDRSHTWDGQWWLSVERSHGVSVLPNANLVQNIGFGPDATHTRTPDRSAMLPAHEIAFPLVHPRKIAIDRAADTFTYYANFRNVPSLRLIGFYRALDFLALVPIRLRKAITKLKKMPEKRPSWIKE